MKYQNKGDLIHAFYAFIYTVSQYSYTLQLDYFMLVYQAKSQIKYIVVCCNVKKCIKVQHVWIVLEAL